MWFDLGGTMRVIRYFKNLFPKKAMKRVASPLAISELEFLSLTKNHRAFQNSLEQLGHQQAAARIMKDAEYVALCWFRLGKEHLIESKLAHQHSLSRTSYSRAYYATYNVSKAVRYFHGGLVSLKGDDHQKAVDLPDDFPDVQIWDKKIKQLYQHRLLADYDNWEDTRNRFTLSTKQCSEIAEDFIKNASTYLRTKFGIST